MPLGPVLVLLLAKILWVTGRPLPMSIWIPSALLWQDIAVGLILGVLLRAFGWRLWTKVVYAAFLLWTAINIPVARTLSSPLTVPMLRATGGALADSIALYVTPANVAIMLLVVGVGALLPRLELSKGASAVVLVVLLAVAAPGPFAQTRTDTRGAERNAFTALALTVLPRVSAASESSVGALRTPPFDVRRDTTLSWLPGTATGRNVVMVFLESTAAQYLRSYGAGDDPMPMMTRLAQQAVQFDAAYAVYPESIKGLFAVLCSRHPALDVSVEHHARSTCAPLARTLEHAGYQTGLFHSGRFAYLGMQPIVAATGFETAEDAGAIGGQIESSFGVDEPSTVARALSWIDARDRTRPFFLAYLPIAGHHPYEAPTGPSSGEGELSAYKNALRYADASVGALIDGLRSRGLDRQTLFLIFGDHGEAFGQHDGNFGHTFFTYEENVHVPLLIAVPGVTTHAVRSRRAASVVDIAPTILALTGLPIPSSYEGNSLLDDNDRLAFFFTDYALAWAGLRDGCWKYLLEVESKRSRLFDVCADPGELRDLASSHADRVDVYRRRTIDWIASTRHEYAR
jgi:phosphoglycerol transferase MdoB-like AlkP superfamily enzyme